MRHCERNCNRGISLKRDTMSMGVSMGGVFYSDHKPGLQLLGTGAGKYEKCHPGGEILFPFSAVGMKRTSNAI